MRFSCTQDLSIKVVHGGINIICNIGKVLRLNSYLQMKLPVSTLDV